MREELKGPEVENVGVAIVEELGEDNEKIYNAYIINLKDKPLESCLVASRGYGENANNGEKINTSTLRHFLDTIPPKSPAKIEPIMEDLFGINNEFWVSFWSEEMMYDKKFIFLAETICEKNFVEIPLILKKGVFIK